MTQRTPARGFSVDEFEARVARVQAEMHAGEEENLMITVDGCELLTRRAPLEMPVRVGEINVSHLACLLTQLLRCINDYID